MDADLKAANIAAAIGEPARAKMLFALLDGHARTSTELAIIAEVSPSTASVHLNRLLDERLVKVHVQGKHRYYALENPQVARALEALSVLGGSRKKFVARTPGRLREARTCYDHIAGTLGVALHDRLFATGWLAGEYAVTREGSAGLGRMGIDVETVRSKRRRFACGCLDWSERRPHLGGALGAALLEVAKKRRWVEQDLDSRALEVTRIGARELSARFGVDMN